LLGITSETSGNYSNEESSVGERGLPRHQAPQTEQVSLSKNDNTDKQSSDVSPSDSGLWSYHPENELLQNRGPRSLYWGSSVVKVMDCGKRGYDLYLETGEKVNFSRKELNAWLSSQQERRVNLTL
jgi:hypothetical protein